MVVEAKKLRVGMNYCLFGNVFSHLWLLTRGAICKPAGLHMETCRIAYGNLPDCIWKPAGLHMETCRIAYGNLRDCIWKPAGLHMAASWIAFASWIVFAMFKR